MLFAAPFAQSAHSALVVGVGLSLAPSAAPLFASDGWAFGAQCRMLGDDHIDIGAALQLEDLAIPELGTARELGAVADSSGGPVAPPLRRGSAGQQPGQLRPQLGGPAGSGEDQHPEEALQRQNLQGGLRFARQSRELMSHARSARAKKAAAKKVERLESAVVVRNMAIDTVIRSLPVAGKLLGKASAASAIGRKQARSLRPSDLKVACRGMHLPAKLAPNLGVKQKRLIATGAKLLLMRQQSGMRRLLRRSRAALAVGFPDQAKERSVHVSHAHMWDEVNARFRFNRDRKFKRSRMSVGTQTVVQRGTCQIALVDSENKRARRFQEHWLCQPKQVAGTAAEAVYPAVLSGLPDALRLDDADSLHASMESVSSATLMFIGDAASSNILLMKKLVEMWEHLPEQEKKSLLVLCDTCGIHMHHRAKLTLGTLRPHTMRHFAIANLHRQHTVQDQVLRLLEMTIPRKVRRRVGAPPTDLRGSLRSFVSIVFTPEEGYHKRGNKKDTPSGQAADLESLCLMVNGELCSTDWVHHCWDSRRQRPCCDSQEQAVDKTLVAVVNSMFGKADPLPAESRWTNTLCNFQKSLLRRAVYKVGLSCFHADGLREAGRVSGRDQLHDQQQHPPADNEAAGDFYKELNASRVSKTLAYYSKDENFHELAVLVNVLRILDSMLLYPLLGDGAARGDGGDLCEKHRSSKMSMLLGKNSNLIGGCTEQLSQLLDQWAGESGRVPWSILDVLDAPLDEEALKRFARGQVLKISGAVGRRYELRFATWPYLLWRLCDDDFADDEKRAVAKALIAAPRQQLDCYSYGIQQCYPTVEELMSYGCVEKLRTDFANHPYGTDLIERLNAEITAAHPRRAGARQFTNAARESVLKQACSIHRASGGDDPLAASAATPVAAHNRVERVMSCPLLPPLTTAPEATIGRPAAAALGAPPSQELLPLPPTQSAGDVDMLAPPGHSTGATRAVVLAGDGVAAAPVGIGFGEPLVVTRDHPAPLAFEMKPESTSNTKKQGLSPFMFHRNRFVQSVKAAKGGTSLTPDELKKAHADFQMRWSSIEDRKGLIQQYQDWRESGAKAEVEPECKVYKCSWGGGCTSTPVSCHELHHFLNTSGWPTDKDTLDLDGAEAVVQPISAEHFSSISGQQIWGIGRAPKNVDRAGVASAQQFNKIEQGFNNFLDTCGDDVQTALGAAGLLVIVEGEPLPPYQDKRLVVIISGRTLRPKVFDCIRCEFVDAANRTSDVAELPFDVKVSERPSKVAPAFKSLDYQTSDEFVFDLTRMFSSMVLWRADYQIPIDIDGSLRFSRIVGTNRVGHLWKLGMGEALMADVTRELRKQRRAMRTGLRTTDPFGPIAQSKVSSNNSAGASTRKSNTKRRGKPEQDAMPLGGGDVARAGNPNNLADVVGDVVGQQPGEESDMDITGGPSEHNDLREEVLDLADFEAESLGSSDVEELEATFADDAAPNATDTLGEREAGGPADATEPDPGFASTLSALIEEVVDGETEGGGSACPTTTGAQSSSSADPLPSAPLAHVAGEAGEVPPWAMLSAVSATGYVYDGMRSVLRIQRGKPQGSVTISCYKHAGCRLLVSIARCETDEEIKKWYFEVGPPPEGASSADKKALAKRHMDLGKAKWFAPRSK